MSDEKIVIVKAKAINPKEKSNRSQLNRNMDRKRESFNANNQNNLDTKVTKIQDKNVNGNYGRIYIQEGNKKNLVYSEYDKKPTSSKVTILRDNEPKKIMYNRINRNNNYSNDRYSDKYNKNKIRNDVKGPKSSQLRRKSIERGGNYKNVQITHIINTSMDIDFHILDPLVQCTEETKNKYRGNINRNNRNGKNGKVKVVCSCSCDNIKIKPKEKKKNIGKIQVINNRANPQLKQINNNKKKDNTTNNYYMRNIKKKN